MKLFDLSFRVKLPLLGALLIVVSALGVSSTLMVAAYAALREDLRTNSEILGRALVPSLLQDMLHEDTWHAFETVSAPTRKATGGGPVKAEILMVIDKDLNVFVSSHPKVAPVLVPLRNLGQDYAAMASNISESGLSDTRTIELPYSDFLYVLTPIADDQVRFGTLIIVVDKGLFLPRFNTIAWYGLLAGLLVLALLLPVNWYWGRRMALPLTQLTERMGEIGKRLPAGLDPRLYNYGDELGRLFSVYNQMLVELRTKEGMEKQIIQSERLAALGQLAASMAHEINNPLGGMLTAIDTLKCHAEIDAQTKKTIDLIERGLMQIKDTVGALLVEARLKKPQPHPSGHRRRVDPDDAAGTQESLAPGGEKYPRCGSLLAGHIDSPDTDQPPAQRRGGKSAAGCRRLRFWNQGRKSASARRQQWGNADCGTGCTSVRAFLLVERRRSRTGAVGHLPDRASARWQNQRDNGGRANAFQG